MLQVTQTQEPAGFVYSLAGTVEEGVQFDHLFGPVNGDIIVNCRNVARINSVGVKKWIAFFQGLKNQGVNVTFEECSPSIVDQLNMIHNFTGGGTVKSVLLPYACTTCGKQFVAVGEVDELRGSGKQVPDLTCEKSGCEASFDDEIDYLFFIK